MDEYDREVINFFFTYYNQFSKESGLFGDKLREVQTDMTESEKILFNQKLSLIYNTLGRLQHEEVKSEQKNRELKEAREGKRGLFD